MKVTLPAYASEHDSSKKRRKATAVALLSAVALALEVEIQVEGVPVGDAFEALLVGVLPLPVEDAEGEVLHRARWFEVATHT